MESPDTLALTVVGFILAVALALIAYMLIVFAG